MLNPTRIIVAGIMALTLAGLAACSNSNKQADKETEAAVLANEKHAKVQPDTVAVATLSTTATVESIDSASRIVTLKNEGGAVNTYKCGKEVINFDQIKVGDKVKVQATQALALFVRKGSGPSAEAVSTVALAPKGAKPGVVVTETREIVARIDAVDAKAQTVTVTGPLGKQRTLDVNPAVDLTGVKPGEDVVLRYTEGLAILVEKAE